MQAAGQVLSTLGYLITPLIVLRLGFVKSITGLELASIPFFLLLAWTTSLPLAILAFLMRGALMQSATPILKNLSMECSSEGAREVMNGVTGCANRIGWVVGPHLGGWLLDQRADNYHVVMLITVAIYLVAVFVTMFLLAPAERRHRETLQAARTPA